MKKIGIVGGISWTSTLDYYKFINEKVNQKLGRLNSCECIIYSLNFQDVQNATWLNAYNLLFHACETLKKCGVDAIALCANTAHLYADKLEEAIQLPFINIISETAKAIRHTGLKTVGLLGTQFTMEMDFYKDQLESFDLKILIPELQETRDFIQNVVKSELGKGEIKPASKSAFMEIADRLILNGAEGIILGCTEIPLLINQNDFSFPVFDTAKIHAEAIVEYALKVSV